ncbi:hypothetical protein C8A01DRAFT_12721 [Parachaetomium inaequale]|uniref:Uncharacterized protein n=1 Tax=Parachaetomium inaequale TaxID=2588326 RepID=A0AAN6PPC8_9PEZI|nr:hypothetical protein C8A01DRAFT_12721 [Parachaetomium inaequale]
MFQRTLRRLKPPQLPDGFSTNFETGTFRLPHTTGQHAAHPTTMSQDFNPSKKVLKFASDHRIAFPTAINLVPGQRVKDFHIRMHLCPHHTFSFYHLKYLAEFEHPLITKILHFYTQEKQTKPLWCYVQGSSTADGSKVVVRCASERMVRAALFRALNAAGYDSIGKSLDGSKPDLRGTIRIAIPWPKAALKVEFDPLVEYLTGLVADAVPRLDGSSPLPWRQARGPRGSWNGSTTKVFL